MFIGHFAVGLASKRVVPKASLGVLLAAPMALDLLWPIFLALGWEEVRIDPGNTAFTPLAFVRYPISHSLLTAIGWSVLFGWLYFAKTHYKRGAVVIGFGVVSHWFLDAIVHRPDLPLYPGSTTLVGLGLWNSISGTITLETAMFAAGIAIYVRTTIARDRIGSGALVAFILLSIVLYVTAALGPAPPNTRTLIVTAFFLWLLPVWAWWIDAHRDLRIAA